jgi:Ca2+-binding RTX toxin-like protein
MVGGVPVDLGVFNNFSTTTVFNLRVEVSNFGIQVFVDDPGPLYNGVIPLISYTYGSVAGAVAAPPALNTIGLYTFDNDAGVTFDNVQIDALTYRYALNLQATLNDTDGSESLSAITLASLPAGVTLTGTSGAIPISGGSASVPITSGVETTVTVTSSTPLTSAQIAAIQSSVTATDTGGVTATTTVGVAQELLGTPASETLNGTASSDWISGGAGNDTLSGGNGNDVLLGGAGSDSLTGGSGADVFKWALADRGPTGSPPTDTVTDFANGAGGDVLDLRDLLVGENANNLASYLHFVTAGGNTTVSVSSTGGFSGGFSSGAVDQVIQLSGVNLVGAFANDTQVIADLLNRGKLVVDGT